MAEAFTTQCVHCEAKLRLGDRGAIGKRISCPKCQSKFIVSAPKSTATKASVRKNAAAQGVEDDWDTNEVSTADSTYEENDFVAGLDAAARVDRRDTASKRTMKAAPARVREAKPEKVKLTAEQKAALRAERENRWEKSAPFLARLGVFGWILGGTIGGAIGASIWAAVTISSGFEFGIIAWALGFFVGFGVRIGSGNDYGVPLGLTAMILTFMSITFARFLILIFEMGGFIESIVGAVIWMTVGMAILPFNLVWVFLACVTAYRASMNDD